jgi:glutamyl-tRNA synthetase
MKPVITRFPPSPTGFLHIGNVRTALFNYLFAKHNGGKMIFRLEDTDKERSKDEYANAIIESLKWLGIFWDNDVVERQSQRSALYVEKLKSLIDAGHAYVSKETPKEPGDRDEVIRFRNPNKTIVFQDLIRGMVEIDTTDLGDFIIAKSMEEPVYHLAVVVDDMEMGVTHVIRGEDHISNTPRHILIQEALGAQRPIYAHVPLVLAPDRSKLSKRKHGAMVSAAFYRERGYLPEALVNYLALLGWNPGTEQEIFTMDKLIAAFDLSRVQKGGAIFDIEKLDWINKEHMRRPEHVPVMIDALKTLLSDYAKSKGWSISDGVSDKAAPVLFERISKLSDAHDILMNEEFDFLFTEPLYGPEKLLWKGSADRAETKRHIEQAIALLDTVPEAAFHAGSAKEAVWPYADASGRGNVLWPVRFALSGREKSPDPFILAGLLGKGETLKRLRRAAQILE